MSEELPESPSDDVASSASSSMMQLFDHAVAELTDDVLARSHEGRASLEALVRQRCARLVDQQLQAFREQAMQREQEAAIRREERNESVRRLLEFKEQRHTDSLDAMVLKLQHARAERISATTAAVIKEDAKRNGSAAHLLLLFWRALTRNGLAYSHPQGPPPAHPPRDRPALRSVRSDGSVTPARPGSSLVTEAAVPTVQPPAATVLAVHGQQIASPSPSLVCRIDAPRHVLGEGAGLNQRSTGSLPTASGEAVMSWGSSNRAPSAGRQPTYHREPSPGPQVRPPALASPGVPFAPQHLQQNTQQNAPGYRPVSTTGSLTAPSQPQQQAAYGGTSSAAPRMTPRSSPPSRAVQMMSGATASWQSGGPNAMVSTPRGVHAEMGQPLQQNSGSYVAGPPTHSPPNSVHGYAAAPGPAAPQRAASGPAAPQTQGGPQPQASPQQSSQVARLRQGSPLSRSRTTEWGQSATLQAAYTRPHVSWGHVQ